MRSKTSVWRFTCEQSEKTRIHPLRIQNPSASSTCPIPNNTINAMNAKAIQVEACSKVGATLPASNPSFDHHGTVQTTPNIVPVTM